MPDLALTKLDDLAVLSARGADAVKFLQGQLSQDLAPLLDGDAVLAGLHNPQGRCIAVLRVLRVTREQLLLVLPAGLAEPVRQILQRYVLRARVKLETAATAWRVYGTTGPDAAAAASTRLSMAMDASGARQLIVAPRGEPLPDGDVVARHSWRRDDIEAGLPEITAATSGLFVAQMLNLDLLGGIAFDKGCYTGQEVIARAHYRGQVKRRMQRFFTESDAVLAPGLKLVLGDGRAAQVVIAAPAESGGQEFLAVTTLPRRADADAGPDAAGEAAADVDADAGKPALPEEQPMLPCVQLPLPYAGNA
jgi:folate-binding protein YgfZ